MEKSLKTIAVVLVLLALARVSSASVLWNAGTAYTGDWSEVKWYDSGLLDYIAHPGGETDTRIATNGVVTVDVNNAVCGLLFLGRGGTPATLVLDTETAYLLVSKDSTELMSMSYDDSAVGTVNHSAGVLKVERKGGAGTGELRMTHSPYGPQDTATYNLSGTGLLDVEVLNRGDKSASNAVFNATGGTLVVRTSIIKWGLVSGGYPGFHQGGALLAPDGVGTIGTMSTGNSSNEMDYFMDNPTSKVEFDLGNGDPDPTVSVNDLIEAWGNFTLDGELKVKFTDPNNPPEIGDKWNVGKVKTGTYQFLGAFDTKPDYIQVNLLDSNQTLQLEYIPEPATLALLLVGGSALLIRRKRS